MYSTSISWNGFLPTLCWNSWFRNLPLCGKL